MITITSNGGEILNLLIGKINEAFSAEKIVRAAAVNLLPEVRNRIHVEGLNSSAEQIGTYSDDYLEVREANGRGRATKVILSLTRQMENNFSAIPIDETGWGLGFTNPLDGEKAKGNNLRYGTEVYKLTTEEEALAIEIMNEEIRNAFY